MGEKRARGLKKSKESQKKVKTEEEEETVVLEIHGQNDMDELEQLFTSALAQLDEDNAEQAILLFRGVIHECDKMLRVRKEGVPDATEEEKAVIEESIKSCPVLPYSFYVTYANGLYYLSLIEDISNEDKIGLLEHGLELLEQAEELEKHESIPHAACRLILQKSVLKNEPIPKEFHDQVDLLLASKNIPNLLEIFQLSNGYTDILESAEKKIEWTETNAKNWQKVVKLDKENEKCFIGLGNCFLGLADDLIQLQEEAEDVKNEQVVPYLQKAINAFKEAVKIQSKKTDLEKSTQINLLLFLGESLVNMGNLTDIDDDGADNSESQKHYAEAVETFEKVLELDSAALPEHFEEFLSQWKQDFE
ncbi:hypothetical protein HK103_000052 [Boothiomyces macroporosus]|uniref:Enhancer of translation termination 1 n=1 Tax=Boothiomyces macroporosus TaxID=261099 RepID=A0AAD5Y6M4_9FUNG|nr:hypothetical protein HK103_000052 [Boothiomyces macroporosus]